MSVLKLNLTAITEKKNIVKEPVIVRRKRKVFVVNQGKAVSGRPETSTAEGTEPEKTRQATQPATTASKQTTATQPAKPRKPRPSFAEIVAPLVEHWPELFDRENRKPLKIGIMGDLIATERVSKTKLKKAMTAWCRHRKYRTALAEGGARYGLDGQPAGEVTAEQQASAKPKKKRENSKA